MAKLSRRSLGERLESRPTWNLITHLDGVPSGMEKFCAARALTTFSRLKVMADVRRRRTETQCVDELLEGDTSRRACDQQHGARAATEALDS
jgi:hypothetical protein